MINYQLIDQSVSFYDHHGFKRIESPWTVTRAVSNITKPEGKKEFEELQDGIEQDNKILQICELCDLVGAIEAYASTKFNLSLDDLIKMMKLTRSAFLDGSRK
jgi:hypothetical protein